MTASVRYIYTAGLGTQTNPTISVTDTPTAGDVYVLLVAANATFVAPTAVSGLGATWTRIAGAVSASQILDAWIGTGATTSGTVSTTAASGDRTLVVYALAGVTPAVSAVTASATTSVTSPAQTAGPGQIVLSTTFADTSANAITTLVPSTGWTEPSPIPFTGATRHNGLAYRTPTAPEIHTTSAARSGTAYVTQIVVGDSPVMGTYNSANNITTANPTVSFTGTPITGDTLLLYSSQGTSVGSGDITAVSGAGATWTKLTFGSGTPAFGAIWRGTGATTSGTITATGVADSNGRALQLYHLRGLGTDYTLKRVDSTAIQAPAGVGQVAILFANAGSAGFEFSAYKPGSTGWNAATEIIQTTGSRFVNSTSNIATAYDTYGATSAREIFMAVLGPAITTTTRTNIIRRPSFEIANTDQFGWTNITGQSTATDQAMFGTRSFKGTASGANAELFGWSSDPGASVTAGQTYTWSAYVRCTSARTAGIAVNYDNNGVGTFSTVSVPANTWTRVSRTETVPAGKTVGRPHIKFTDSVNGDTVWFDGLLAEAGSTLGTYFDGSTVLSGKGYEWTATANDSPSTEKTPVVANTISSALSGSGTLTSGFTNYLEIASAFSGSGTLTSSLHRYINSALSGSGTLTSAFTNYQNIDSQLSGSGTLTSTLGRFIQAGFSGSGTLTSALHRYIQSNLSGSGTLGSALSGLQHITSSLSGSGTLSSLLSGYQNIASAFSGSGTLTSELSSTGPAPETPALPYLGKLARFTVSTSAVPLNPASGSSSTPSVSATYTKGTDPEFMLGETNVLKNGAIGTYEGEVVKLTLAEASGLASLSMNTPLTLLNNELHLFPFIDGVPGPWTAARAIDYWTQQCGLFYDKVPGDVVAYASGYGHTDCYGASTTERFYEKLVGGTTTTTVLNGRSVRTLGSAVTGTTALHEVKDGSVTASLPSGKKLVFSIGLGLLGTGRTSTVTWSFLDNAGVSHAVSLEATSTGSVTAKIGSTTVASASVPAGGQYRLALSVERTATEVTSKLTVHTDDLEGAGTLEHDGAEGTVTYALPGVLNLTSITHASAGGSGAEMVRWGTYLTVAAEHPLELPAVQKVLAETKKPFEFVSGFEGNVWAMMAEFCAIARLDLGFRDRQLHVGPRTQTLTLPGGSFSRFENNWERRDKYKQVALVNKQSKAVTTDDAVLWRADSVFQVAAREVFETTVQTGHSILSLAQPQPVTGILPFPYKEGAGQYVVTGADGYIIAPAWWNDNGGKVEVSLTGKEGEIAIKITAPALDNVRAPYRISEGAADRPALYICGSGIINDPVEVHVGTGARNAKEGFDSVFESPFLAGVRETFDTAASMGHEYSASNADTTFELPNGFETPTGFGQFPAGTLFTDNVRNYRVMDASQTHSRVSGNAVPHTTIGAYVASYPEGATIADEKARHAGRTIRQFNIKPLKGA